MTANLSPSTPVGEVMVTGVLSLNPDDTIGRARELMLSHGVHGLPVVDPQGAVVGFVTSSDLVEEWPLGEAVETIMSTKILSIDVERPAAEAASVMLENRVHHLLVTRNDRPVAIVSSFDLLKVVAAAGTSADTSRGSAGPTNLVPVTSTDGV